MGVSALHNGVGSFAKQGGGVQTAFASQNDIGTCDTVLPMNQMHQVADAAVPYAPQRKQRGTQPACSPCTGPATYGPAGCVFQQLPPLKKCVVQQRQLGRCNPFLWAKYGGRPLRTAKGILYITEDFEGGMSQTDVYKRQELHSLD